ncbi:hypothetical protein BH10ACI1_BH10ACI1_09610 [soil metagenome]
MIEHTIFCDSCGEMIDIQTGSTRQVRRKAKKKGLLVRILRKDYCQRCAEKLHIEGEIDGLNLPEKPLRK